MIMCSIEQMTAIQYHIWQTIQTRDHHDKRAEELVTAVPRPLAGAGYDSRPHHPPILAPYAAVRRRLPGGLTAGMGG